MILNGINISGVMLKMMISKDTCTT